MTFQHKNLSCYFSAAPEVLKNEGYNRSLDLWSVGVIIYVRWADIIVQYFRPVTDKLLSDKPCVSYSHSIFGKRTIHSRERGPCRWTVLKFKHMYTFVFCQWSMLPLPPSPSLLAHYIWQFEIVKLALVLCALLFWVYEMSPFHAAWVAHSHSMIMRKFQTRFKMQRSCSPLIPGPPSHKKVRKLYHKNQEDIMIWVI